MRIRPNAHPCETTHRRRGITLLEVMLALAIFLISLAAISQICSLGSRAATEADRESEAVLRAETALSEVLAGVYPLESTGSMPFSDDPNRWSWSLNVVDGPLDDLLQLTLTVHHTGEIEGTKPVFTLARQVRNPQLFIDAAVGASSTTSTSTTSSSSEDTL